MNQLQLIIGAIVFAIFVASGWYVKSLYDENMQCKINTKSKEEAYKVKTKYYEENIKDIVSFFEGERSEVNNFKKGSNETDCEATKRFLDSRPY